MQNTFKTFGFSGSRSVSKITTQKVAAISAVCSKLGSVLVGCASGTDQAVRVSVPSALVFRVGRGAFAARSIKFVRALSCSSAPVLVSFPSSSCPSGVPASKNPSLCFCGLGSGSWATLGFAVGLGVPVHVFLPSGVSPPQSWGSWSFVQSGLFTGSWSFIQAQSTLF